MAGRLVHLALLQTPGGLAKPHAQRDMLIFITDFAEYLTDSVRPASRFLDQIQRVGGLGVAAIHALEQGAVERAAILGAILVNPATASIERGAGLIEFFLEKRTLEFFAGRLRRGPRGRPG